MGFKINLSNRRHLVQLRDQLMGFRFAVESYRLVSTEQGEWTQVLKIDIPDAERTWYTNMTGIGQLSNITESSSQYAALNLFRYVARYLYLITYLQLSVTTFT